MISAGNLTDEQRAAITKWAEEGAQLPGIQQNLNSEFGLNATYMDTRFLILDLGIELQAVEEPEEEDAGGEQEGEAPTETADPSPLDPGAGGGISVTVDELTRPGMMVSGSVLFSDGEKAVWFIDQMGRPGLDPSTPGYQPNDPDLEAFEVELRKLLGGGPAE